MKEFILGIFIGSVATTLIINKLKEKEDDKSNDCPEIIEPMDDQFNTSDNKENKEENKKDSVEEEVKTYEKENENDVQ